jgi:mannosyltransferase
LAKVDLRVTPVGAAVQERPRTHGAAYIALLGAVAAACALLWLPALRSSLSIDEAGTFWVVKDGLAKAFGRSLEFQGQSPLYYVIDWVALKLFGHSEPALRIPSLLAAALTLVPVFRLAQRLFDRETALIAAGCFAATSSVAFAASDARPYAIALLLASVATLKLVRWLDSGSARQRVLYVAFAALTIYVHYLYAIVILAHVAYVAARRRTLEPSVRQLLVTPALIAAACTPLVPQFLALWRRSSGLAWTGDPKLRQLLLAVRAPALLLVLGLAFLTAKRVRNGALQWLLAPVLGVALVASIGGVRILRSEAAKLAGGPRVVAAVVLVLATAALVSTAKRYGRRANPLPEVARDRDGLVLALAWSLVPPLATFLVSLATPVEIFTPRYFFSATPGVVLLAAWAIRRAGPTLVRVAAVLVVFATTATLMHVQHSPDDWQSAIKRVNAIVSSDDEPVLVSAGFVEANQVAWLNDPSKAAFTLSPLAFYSVRGRVVAMPFDPLHDAAPYVQRVIDGMRAPEFVVITNKLHVLPEILERALRDEGYRVEATQRYGWLRVTTFTRR